jgi:hypothetical protein
MNLRFSKFAKSLPRGYTADFFGFNGVDLILYLLKLDFR